MSYPVHLPLLTNSAARAYRRCPREYQIGYVQGYRDVERAAPLLFGSLFHVALEAWWRTVGTAPDSALDAALATIPADTDPYEAAKATELLRGYDARWGGEDLEVLSVEVEFSTAVVNPDTGATSRTWALGGAIDAIARRRGEVFIVEHKTTSEDIGTGSPYWRRLTLDTQVSTYFAGARALGHDVAGCIYDVVRKPGIKPLRATPEADRKYTKAGLLYAAQRTEDETPEAYGARLREDIAANPDRYYQRGDVVRLAEEERDAAADTWAIARDIRDAELAGRYPRNPDSCLRWGRTCGFFDVCTRVASLEDETRFRRVERVNEELSSTAA